MKQTDRLFLGDLNAIRLGLAQDEHAHTQLGQAQNKRLLEAVNRINTRVIDPFPPPADVPCACYSHAACDLISAHVADMWPGTVDSFHAVDHRLKDAIITALSTDIRETGQLHSMLEFKKGMLLEICGSNVIPLMA
eukprot:1162154-Pelagomonas_calceolata.AAC.11